MIDEAIHKSKIKLIEFANLASEYLRLRLAYITLHSSFHMPQEVKEVTNQDVGKYLAAYMSRAIKERQLIEKASKLNTKFNEALLIVIEELQKEDIGKYSLDDIKKIQEVLSRFYRLATMDMFKGVLYIEGNTKQLLYELSREIDVYQSMPQYFMIKTKIDSLIKLTKSENIH